MFQHYISLCKISQRVIGRDDVKNRVSSSLLKYPRLQKMSKSCIDFVIQETAETMIHPKFEELTSEEIEWRVIQDMRMKHEN